MSVSSEIAKLAGAAGGGAGLTSFLTYLTNRRKVPAEVDSIIVTGAEKTVAAAVAVAEAEGRRADRAEARNVELEARIEMLEGKLASAQSLLDAVRQELHDLRNSD